jgi:hypothetical protein
MTGFPHAEGAPWLRPEFSLADYPPETYWSPEDGSRCVDPGMPVRRDAIRGCQFCAGRIVRTPNRWISLSDARFGESYGAGWCRANPDHYHLPSEPKAGA